MGSSIPNRGPELLAVNITFLVMAVIACALRCFVRFHMVKNFGLDDWLMVAATCSFICYISFSNSGVTYGTGRHHEDLDKAGIKRATNYWWYCYLFYCLSMIASKLSIGFFLLRISVRKLHAWIIYLAMFVSVLAGGVFFFVTLFQCRPISYFWNKDQEGGHCVSIEVIIALAQLYSAFAIISDFTFAILPAFLVWNLQLKRSTKMALIPLLAMGCIASSAVIVRSPYLLQFRNPDFLWATLDIAIWSTIEQGLAITAGSLATLRPLFQLALARMGLATATTTRPTQSKYGPGFSPSASAVLGSRKRDPKTGEQDADVERFDLGSLSEVGGGKSGAVVVEEEEKGGASHSWFGKSKRGSIAGGKKMNWGKSSDGESQKSLHSRNSAESIGRQESGGAGSEGSLGMNIMVSKTFFVTGEEKR